MHSNINQIAIALRYSAYGAMAAALVGCGPIEIRPAEGDDSEQMVEEYAPGRSGPQGSVNYLLPGRDRAIPILYEEIDGLAIAEGDIILGPISEIEGVEDFREEECEGDVCTSYQPLIVRKGESFRWPAGVIPYDIDDDFNATMQSRIEDAIAMVADTTDLLLVERNGQRDYVEFRSVDEGCSSPVGRQTDSQILRLENNCSAGNAAHEILHAAGAWHEQSRSDRDDFVTILWDNIEDGKEGNFEKKEDELDIGEYDYGSIMHYPSWAFGKEDPDTGATLTTIEVEEAGATIGQRSALSDRDIAAINQIYSAEDCVGFNPDTATVSREDGRWKIVDGSHWVFDFGPSAADQAEANRSLAIIQHYGINQSCFVGRPNPSAQYLLVDGNAPSGSAPSEDCIWFNRSNLEVRDQGGTWILTDGNSSMIAFDVAGEAYRTMDLLQNYGFNRQCFVGRPNASFRYFRQ